MPALPVELLPRACPAQQGTLTDLIREAGCGAQLREGWVVGRGVRAPCETGALTLRSRPARALKAAVTIAVARSIRAAQLSVKRSLHRMVVGFEEIDLCICTCSGRARSVGVHRCTCCTAARLDGITIACRLTYLCADAPTEPGRYVFRHCPNRRGVRDAQEARSGQTTAQPSCD